MEKAVLAFAPGRVELLGNHTDYNEGLALAAAIDRGVTIRAEKLGADVIEVISETNGREVSVSLKNLAPLGEERWANYPIGVIKSLREAGFEIGGLRLHVSSSLAPGSGLSSSAAFEVATAVTALELFDLNVDPIASTIQGVLGARLTGGGFGGATVWLVEKDKAQEILTRVSEAYRQKTGVICTALITKASQGARIL